MFISKKLEYYISEIKGLIILTLMRRSDPGVLQIPPDKTSPDESHFSVVVAKTAGLFRRKQ